MLLFSCDQDREWCAKVKISNNFQFFTLGILEEIINCKNIVEDKDYDDMHTFTNIYDVLTSSTPVLRL